MEEESPLGAALQEEFCDALIDTGFRWSGKNSINARYRAALQLRRYLTRNLQNYPDAEHFVIAHSHGGTIALKAASFGGLGEKLRGIVCVSTPFLHPIPRPAEAGRMLIALIDGLTAVVVGLGVIELENLLHTSFSFFDWRSLSLLLVLELAAVFAVTIGFLRLPVAVLRLARRASVPMSTACDVLIVRATGDEASGVLAVSHFTGWLLQAFWRVLYRTAFHLTGSEFKNRSARSRHTIWEQKAIRNAESLWFLRSHSISTALREWLLASIIAGVVLSGLFYFCVSHPMFSFLSRRFGSSTIGDLALVFGPFALAGAAGLICVTVTSVMSSLAIGWEMLWASPLLDITAEMTPEGRWRVFHVPVRDFLKEDDIAAGTLAHSAFFLEPFAILEIIAWIKSMGS